MKSCRVIWALSVLCLGLANVARADLAEGLVSYWALDEIDGSSTPDYASSNVVNIVGGITLVPSGVPTTTPGLFTNAFAFPNSLSYFTTAGTGVVPTGLPIFKSPNGYTVSMWVKAATNTTAHYIYTESSTSGGSLLLMQNGNTVATTNKLDILIRNDSAIAQLNHIVSTSVVFDNTWHHIAFVDSHGTAALYVDGRLDATSFKYNLTGTYTLNVSTVGALVRGTVAANVFAGTIDNVGLWARVLTQAEVQQFMSNSVPLPIVQSKPVLQSVSPNNTNSLGDSPPTFNVNVLGSNPIGYQWYSNGIPVNNQTNNTFTLAPLVAAGTTVYSVISSNLLGALTNNISEVVSPDPTNNLPGGLISYWPLDTINTNTGSTPDLYSHDDFILSTNNGSSPSLITGEFANALAFDATQSEYGVCNNGTPNFLSTNYSISLWVNGQPQAQLRVFSESSTNNGTPLFTIGTETSGFLPYASIFIRNDAGSTLINNLHGSLPAFDGTWHHLVWVDQNGNGLLYVDGVLDSVSYAYKRTGTFSLNTTSIGATVRGTAGNFFTGGIDDVAIWNPRLTYSEIQTLQASTPPPPTSIIPPSIISFAYQPPDPTNNLFVGDTISLTVQASGTAPLSYQWLKNGQPIDPAVNATATRSAFVINNAQAADTGGYSVVITNGDPTLPGGGSVTSAVLHATVQAFTPVTNGLALQLDFDALGFTNTQPGFQMYNTSLAGYGFANGIRVTVAGVGTTLQDRDRTAAPWVVNGPGMTQAQIYNDFILPVSSSNGTGLSISLSHLAPSTPYAVTIWAFDPVSPGNRVSDWTELSSGTPILIVSNYTFNGAVLPVADYQDSFRAVLTSSPSGTLLIQGVTDATSAGFGAFLNAIQLVANPGPSVNITGSRVAPDGNLQIFTTGQYSGQPISFIYSPDLTPGSWQPVLNSITVTNSGLNTTSEIPIGTGTNAFFFRAVGH